MTHDANSSRLGESHVYSMTIHSNSSLHHLYFWKECWDTSSVQKSAPTALYCSYTKTCDNLCGTVPSVSTKLD